MAIRKGFLLGVALLAFGASSLAPSPARAGLHLDWKLKEVYVSSASDSVKLASGYAGTAMKVRCTWTASITESALHDKTLEWQGMIWWQGAMKETRMFNAKYPKNNEIYFKEGEKSSQTAFYEQDKIIGMASNEFNGTGSAAWTPTAPGKYTVGCEIALPGPDDGEFSTDRGNNAKQFTFTVAPLKPVQSAAWATAPAITLPAEGASVLPVFKIAVTPHDSYQNCTQGGSIQLEKLPKVLSKPLVAACVPGGTVFDFTWTPGTYQVRARQVNAGKKFESGWSEWRTFTVIGAAGRGN
ncbi:MAG: hypothetical protein HY900_00390 [Deltaproteobacteria bacterium]|nr:hypothetical protein [Deltaproteobacteria bacterium]